MIYRVTLPGYFALHTADSALADAWKNHFGGTVAQIHLGDIKSVSEMPEKNYGADISTLIRMIENGEL